MTSRWKASLTYGEWLGEPKSRAVLVSFSLKSRVVGAVRPEVITSQLWMVNGQSHRARRSLYPGQPGPAGDVAHGAVLVSPTPGIAKPEGWKEMKGCAVRPAVGHGDAGENVVLVGLGVLDQDIKIAIFGEDACVEQFILVIIESPAAIFLDQLAVWEGNLGTFVTASSCSCVSACCRGKSSIP